MHKRWFPRGGRLFGVVALAIGRAGAGDAGHCIRLASPRPPMGAKRRLRRWSGGVATPRPSPSRIGILGWLPTALCTGRSEQTPLIGGQLSHVHSAAPWACFSHTAHLVQMQ